MHIALAAALGLTLTAASTSAPTPTTALTKENGAPVPNNLSSEAASPGGAVLLQDFHLIEKLARFDRERIPERVVHARGVGAHGEFTAAGDFSSLTSAKVLSGKGKKTPMFVRFSTVIHPSGSPETLRDPRGFALKFYTEEGNWDLVGNNLNVFFIKDAMQFSDMVHSLKPSPVTNQQEPGRFFAFFAAHPESTHMLTQLYSDLGTPANHRQMDGSSVHAFKFVNAKGQVSYVKLSWRSLQGNASLATVAQREGMQAKDFSHATRDLYDNISKGNFPRWELRAQVIPEAKLADFTFSPLDATKAWPEDQIAPVVLGTFTLNKVPDNFFQFTEQVAFSPGVLVPGIEPSEDRLLQGRLFSYADTQRYRVGVNYQQLPVNAPRANVVTNNQDGALNGTQRDSDINFAAVTADDARPRPRSVSNTALVDAASKKVDDFTQAGDHFRALDKPAQQRLVENFAGDLKQVKDSAVKAKILAHLKAADAGYGARVEALVK